VLTLSGRLALQLVECYQGLTWELPIVHSGGRSPSCRYNWSSAEAGELWATLCWTPSTFCIIYARLSKLSRLHSVHVLYCPGMESTCCPPKTSPCYCRCHEDGMRSVSMTSRSAMANVACGKCMPSPYQAMYSIVLAARNPRVLILSMEPWPISCTISSELNPCNYIDISSSKRMVRRKLVVSIQCAHHGQLPASQRAHQHCVWTCQHCGHASQTCGSDG